MYAVRMHAGNCTPLTRVPQNQEQVVYKFICKTTLSSLQTVEVLDQPACYFTLDLTRHTNH
mgnify:CR=1 FL=1